MQVWYHVCPNRGRGCYNTRLKDDGGCTIWYNEKEVNWGADANSTLTGHNSAPPIMNSKFLSHPFSLPSDHSSCRKLRSISSAPSPSVSQTSKCLWMTLTERSPMVSAGRREVCVEEWLMTVHKHVVQSLIALSCIGFRNNNQYVQWNIYNDIQRFYVDHQTGLFKCLYWDKPFEMCHLVFKGLPTCITIAT